MDPRPDPAAAPPPFGFIGLGMMGQPMALRLLATGAAVLVADRSPAALAALAAAAPPGAALQQAGSLAELAARCDVIALMLPDSRAVDAVLQGPDGLLAALRPGMLVVDMGSSLPAATRAAAAAAAARGARLIDAPVSGSVPKARDGTLAIMAGGDDAAFAQAEPLLGRLGATLIRTGDVGSAHAMKALNNYVYAAGLLAACEALHMADALGLDTGILTDVLNASSGRNVATETKLRQAILTGRYDAGFQLGLMRKDLATAGSIAAETAFPAEVLQACSTRWDAAVAELGPQVDNTAIHRHLAGRRKARAAEPVA